MTELKITTWNVNSINSEEDLMVESLLITKTKHKTQKTPKKEIEKALKIKAAYENEKK